MGRFTRTTAAAVAVISLVLGGLAAADQLVASGDDLTPTGPTGFTLDLGEVCADSTLTKPMSLALRRQGGGAAVFRPSTPVTVSVLSATPASVSATVSPSSITLPSNWSALPDDTKSAPVSAAVTLAAGGVGAFQGSVSFRASGVNNQNGNALTRDVTVSVTADVVACDTAPPVVAVPGNLTVEATSPAGAAVTFAASATDADPANPAVTCTPASGSTFPLGTTTVACSATDAAGNVGDASFSVSVVDTTAPLVAAPADVTAPAVDASGAMVTYDTPGATDAVTPNPPVTCLPGSGSTFALGSTVVTCSATDAAGLTGSAAFTVTVADQTAPVLVVPDALVVEATGSAGAAVDYGASASDLVDGSIEPVCEPPTGTTLPLGETDVTCNATDAAGNATTRGFSVEVVDTTPPAITVPTVDSVEATGPTTVVVWAAPSASDLVDGDVPVTCSHASGTAFEVGTHTLSCSATDSHGNATQATFTVTVTDHTPPELTLPADQLLEATGPAGAIATFAASAQDLVDGPVIPTCSAGSGATFPIGTTTVDCEAVDAQGNRSSGSFTIQVQDTRAPEVFVPEDLTEEATGPDGAVVEFEVTGFDVVDEDLEPTCVPASGSTFALAVTTVDCSATDAAGNTGSSSFTVTVHDTTAPVVGAVTGFSVEATGPAGAQVEFATPSASDAVTPDPAVTCDPPSGSTFSLGDTTVTCSATDAAGNTGSSSFTLTIEDTTAPALSLPDAITAEATGPDGVTVDYAASAFDVVDGELDPGCVPPSGTTFGLGETVVGCAVSDANGNDAAGSFTVTVVDTTPPVITVPNDILVEATGPLTSVEFDAPSAFDLVDASVTVVCDAASGDAWGLGTHLVICEAADSRSNAATASFTITVEDTTAPTLDLPGDLTYEATGPGGAATSFEASASDLVDGDRPVTCTPPSGATVPLGATTVTCVASDESGNTASGSFVVHVVDTTEPSLTVPGDLVVEATGPQGAVVAFATSADDIVDGTISTTCAPPSGAVFPLGPTPVMCTATDVAGNTGSAGFNVVVVDTTAPVVDQPAQISLEATGPAGAVATFDTPAATDAVTDGLVVTCEPPSSSTFPLGTTMVTCSATDDAGNIGTSQFTVTVSDTTAPTLVLPGDLEREATGPSGAAVTWSASATDIVDGAVTPGCSPSSGATFPLGTTPVSCSATDAAGNSANAGFGVTVVDTTAPVLTVPGAVTIEATGPTTSVSWIAPTAVDLVDGTITPSCDVTPGTAFAVGVHTVTCTATDSRGNTATETFSVTVADTTAPAVTVPDAQHALASSASGATVAYPAASAVDLVDGLVATLCLPASGSLFAPGTTTVSCTAVDGHGNDAAASFTVTVSFDVGDGFLAPVKTGVLNVAKNGSTVPLKWQVPAAGGGWIQSTSIVTAFRVLELSCSDLDQVIGETVATTTGGTELRYDLTAEQFIQNWQTPKRPGKCYQARIELTGGQVIAATFQLK